MIENAGYDYTSESMTATKAMHDPGPALRDVLQEIEKSIAELREEAEAIAARLEPVLQPEMSNTVPQGTEAIKSHPSSPVVSQLRDLSHTIRQNTRRLQNVRRRLDV